MAKTRLSQLTSILAIIVGIIIIAMPAILAWAIGIYLIIIGILNLLNK